MANTPDAKRGPRNCLAAPPQRKYAIRKPSSSRLYLGHPEMVSNATLGNIIRVHAIQKAWTTHWGYILLPRIQARSEIPVLYQGCMFKSSCTIENWLRSNWLLATPVGVQLHKICTINMALHRPIPIDNSPHDMAIQEKYADGLVSRSRNMFPSLMSIILGKENRYTYDGTCMRK